MTMLEFWSCYDVYCKSKGIDTEGANIHSLRQLMENYGARSLSIKERKDGTA